MNNPNLEARAELNKCPAHWRFAWNYEIIVPSDLRKKPKVGETPVSWKDKT